MIAMNGWPMQVSEALEPQEDWNYLLVVVMPISNLIAANGRMSLSLNFVVRG